jgi:hypothetical protein
MGVIPPAAAIDLTFDAMAVLAVGACDPILVGRPIGRHEMPDQHPHALPLADHVVHANEAVVDVARARLQSTPGDAGVVKAERDERPDGRHQITCSAIFS